MKNLLDFIINVILFIVIILIGLYFLGFWLALKAFLLTISLGGMLFMTGWLCYRFGKWVKQKRGR